MVEPHLQMVRGWYISIRTHPKISQLRSCERVGTKLVSIGLRTCRLSRLLRFIYQNSSFRLGWLRGSLRGSFRPSLSVGFQSLGRYHLHLLCYWLKPVWTIQFYSKMFWVLNQQTILSICFGHFVLETLLQFWVCIIFLKNMVVDSDRHWNKHVWFLCFTKFGKSISQRIKIRVGNKKTFSFLHQLSQIWIVLKRHGLTPKDLSSPNQSGSRTVSAWKWLH